jgi:hypothetical protein
VSIIPVDFITTNGLRCRKPWAAQEIDTSNSDMAYCKAISSLLHVHHGVFVMEGDVRVSKWMFDALLPKLEDLKDEVVVLPYRLHPNTTGLNRSVLAHRKVGLDGTTWIEPGDLHADLFGFGATYIPNHLWFMAMDTNMDRHWSTLDSSFSSLTHGLGVQAHVIWDFGEIPHLHH